MFKQAYNFIQSILNEGLTALHKQWVKSGKISSEVFDKAVEGDPTRTKKYVAWMLKRFVDEQLLAVPVETIRLFDELVEKDKIDNKDIYSYKNTGELIQAIRAGQNKQSRKEIETEVKAGAEGIQRDDDWIVVQPVTHEAMMYYGKGTTWCITQADGSHWTNYTQQEQAFFVIISRKDFVYEVDAAEFEVKAGDKFCLSLDTNYQYELYDAQDSNIDAGDLPDELGPVLAAFVNFGLMVEDFQPADYETYEEDTEAREQKYREESQDNILMTAEDIIRDIKHGARPEIKLTAKGEYQDWRELAGIVRFL